MGSELRLNKDIKKNIESLIENGDLYSAKKLLKSCEESADKQSIAGVMKIVEGDFIGAEKSLLKGLELDSENSDIMYNLGYAYEKQKKYKEAIRYFMMSKERIEDLDLKKEIDNIIDNIERELKVQQNKKIVFFVKQGMDNFLDDIINSLSNDYDVKKVRVTEYSQIDQGMKWADICWFEWCDELIIYGSNLLIARERLILCRIHSYEVFTDNLEKVRWENVNKIVFVGQNIQEHAIEKFQIDKNKTLVISNGVDLKRWSFIERKQGFNVAYVGYINYKKGPMLLLQIFKALYDKDNRYNFYIAGKFQEERDMLYFRQMILELGLEKNFHFEGWQNDLDNWLKDKDYILCTSIVESQNMSVMQAMAKGIKPVVHNFVGAKKVYSKKHIFNTIEEAVKRITSEEYNSKDYREFIEGNYNLSEKIIRINQTLNNMNHNVKTDENERYLFRFTSVD